MSTVDPTAWLTPVSLDVVGETYRAAAVAGGRATMVAALVGSLTWSEASAAQAQCVAPFYRAPQPGSGAQPMANAALAAEEAPPGTRLIAA